MKLIYISPSQLPSKAAHSVHIMKMCEAFVKNGHKVLLINPNKTGQLVSNKEIYEYYNVAPVFQIKNFKYLNYKGNKTLNAVRRSEEHTSELQSRL